MTDTAGPDASAPSAVKGVGAQLGEYELVHELSSDADSSVFLARSKGANGVVRVLVLECASPALTERAGGAADVITRTQSAAKIKSLNAVPPLDARDSDGLFVVGDPVDGASLSELTAAVAKAGEKIALDVALRIVVDALGGLHAAHQSKPDAVVHGGLTPARLVTAAEGTTKATDFVLGRSRSDAERGPYVSDLASAPTVAGDIFSVGVIAWELITGKRLFGGDAPAVTDRSGEIPAPSTLAENVPAKLDAVLAKALARDAAGRFATAAEFARAIETSGAKVALRSAVGAVMTKVLKDSLTQRRDLLRRLRTAVTASAAGSATRTPLRPSLPAPAIAPAKPGEGGLRRAPTMMGIPMPKPPTIDAQPAEATPPSAATPIAKPDATAATPSDAPDASAPATSATASAFGSPAIAPGGPVIAPRPLAPEPSRIAAPSTPRPDSTQPLESVDLISIVPNAPAKKSPDQTAPISLEDVTELTNSEVPPEPVNAAPPSPPPVVAPSPASTATPEATDSAPAAPVTAAASASAATATASPVVDASVPIDSDIEIPIEAGAAVPEAVADAPKPGPKVLPTAPIAEGFDDDEPIHLPTNKSNTRLYAMIGGVAVLVIGIAAFALRGGSHSDVQSTSAPPTETAAPTTANQPTAITATVTPPTEPAPTPVAPSAAVTAVADAGPSIAAAPPTAAPPTVEQPMEPPTPEAPPAPPPPVVEAAARPTHPASTPAASHAQNNAVHAAHVAPPPPARSAPHAAAHTHATPPPSRPARATTTHPAPAHTAPPPRRHEFRPGGL